MGQHVYTSSNIGMAMESCMLGAPTIAVGVAEKVGGYTEEELKPVAEFIGKNVEKFVKMKLPNHTFLNINVPLVTKYKDIKGIKVCNLSRLILPCSYVEKTDPSGGKYYWTDRSAIKNDLMGEEFARTWYDRGYITIVPINYDATDFECVARWNESVLKDIKKGRKKA
jgi:5'/3'-nucleotidase SurE